jgi:pimeloyl-ACP methyl ester carboxylesterase
MKSRDVQTLAVVSRRALLKTAAGLGSVATLGILPDVARARATPYPVEAFFTTARTRAATLSPGGTLIAVLDQLGTDDAPHGVIDVLDASDPEGQRKRIDLGATEVESMQWANDERLLVRVAVTVTVGPAAVTGSNRRTAARELTSKRLMSVSAVTGEMAVMFQDDRRRLRTSRDLGRIIDLLRQDPDHVLMSAWERDGVLGLHKVNVETGSADRIERGSSGTIGWETQGGVPVIRYDINPRGTVLTISGRAPGTSAWRPIRRNRIGDLPEFEWVGETETPGTILVTARAEGEDTMVVREMDLETFGMGAALSHRAGRDVMHGIVDAAGRYVGAAFYGERLEYDFADAALGAHHRALNAFMDNDCDIYLNDLSRDHNRMVVGVTGPREPGAWYFYDREAQTVVNLGAIRLLDYERLGLTDTLSVTTRDGATIEAYLTAPPGGQPGPLVVLPHGGPEVRDLRDWDRQVQVLAAQGWWVLRPNFRGSGGYGMAFAQAGWTRWGDRMQEDIEDAVDQAIALKGLDAARVAIMGTSYGGYAALMGAVRRPDLYKAAIAICGVADLPEMLDWERREDDTDGRQIYSFWVKRIGDPDTMGPQLAAASPRRRAGEITCPVLLVHGVDDPVVPVIESRRMNNALRDAGKTVELIEVEDAGHADWPAEKEQELLERYIALLKQAFA